MDPTTYALHRIEQLTAEIAGCLTPATLRAVIDDITDNHTKPVQADLKRFARDMQRQLAVLGENSGDSA